MVYLHLTRFPVQRRVRDTPSLAGRAFVLHEEIKGHRRVAFASSAALRAGVRPAMTLTAAQALCPALTHAPFVAADELRALKSLGEALLTVAPAFQVSAPDGLWLDPSAAPLCGGEQGLVLRAQALCEVHGYRARGVVAGSLYAARALARHAPRLEVRQGAPRLEARHSAPHVQGSRGAPQRDARPGEFQLEAHHSAPHVQGRRGAPHVSGRSGELQLEVRHSSPPISGPSGEQQLEARHGAPRNEARHRTQHLGAPHLLVVPEREEAAALAALPLAALEGAFAVEALAALGLSVLGEVAALPPSAVVARLGTEGLRAHRLCRGEDDTRLVPQALEERIEERIDLDWPAEALEPLLFALKTTLDRLCARLTGRKRAAVRLTFALKLDPTGEAQVTLALSRPSAAVKLLLELAKHRLADLTLQNPVAALVVRVDEACEAAEAQLSLGDGPQGDVALEGVLSRLHTTLGEDALFAAELEAVHRPEGAYARRAFRPPEAARGMLADAERAGADPRGSGGSATTADLPLTGGSVWERPRRKRPPPPAEPDGSPLERPVRCLAAPSNLEAELGAQGELLAAQLMGKRRKATAVAGPERLCGEWWTEDPFARDYYRVHFEGLGPVWIYRDSRDGRFYLHGLFD